MGSRDYVFTVFNKDSLIETFDTDKVKYIIWGREICPKTKRKHLQCYVIFDKVNGKNKTYRIKAAQKIIGVEGCHMEAKRGSRDEARNYCMKDGDYEEWGEFDPVTKEDLFKKPIPWLQDNYPEFYCRYHRGLEKIANRDKGPKWRTLNVTWLHGPPDSLKTKTAMAHNSVYKCDDFQWWDGYEGEERIVLDEFEPEDLKRKQLLNILDGYQLRIPTKGGFTYAKWTEVYITSNWDPTKWIKSIEGLSRRVTNVTRLG